MKNEIIGKRERTRTFNLQFWRLLPYLLGYSLILELSIRFELMWTRSLRLTKPLQSTTMGTQHFMVGNVGLEPLFLTPNQVCYHYTTFPKWCVRLVSIQLFPKETGLQPAAVADLLLTHFY